MENKPTVPYHANDVIFELPAQLKDKTMHMFALNDDGPSAFSLVVSHADTQGEENLDSFGERLLKELGRALPKFQLKGMKERLLDDSPAIEFSYSWRNDGVFMHQRQVITLVQGPAPDSTQALMMAATCLKAFTDEWNEAFDKMLGSVKLRRPLSGSSSMAQAAVTELSAASAPMLPHIFALSTRRRALHVFDNEVEACRKTDAREVEVDAWAFFDADGNALETHFVEPNSGTLWRKPGTYVLKINDAPDARALQEYLPQVAVLENGSTAPFADLTEVQSHLQRRSRGGSAND